MELCVQLSIPIYSAAGVLETLWHFTAKFAQQGDIGRFSNAAIARAIQWENGADELIQALVDCNWIDKDPVHRLAIHNWHEHADDYVHNRLARAHQFFVGGHQPKFTRLPSREREIIEQFYRENTAPEAHKNAQQAPGERSEHVLNTLGERSEHVLNTLGERSASVPPVPVPVPVPVPDNKNLSSTDVDAGSPPKSWFDEKHEVWYRAYWNRVGKQDSRRAYEKAITLLVKGKGKDKDYEGAARFLLLEAANDRKRFETTRDWDWRRGLHPATWLNGKRWEDEANHTSGRPKPRTLLASKELFG